MSNPSVFNMNSIFFQEFGVEPFGYIGAAINAEEIAFTVYNSKHSSLSTVPNLGVQTIAGRNYIHRVYSTLLHIQASIPATSSNSIHRVLSSVPAPKLIFTVHNSIHKQYFLNKWNAHFSYNCANYLDTPYKFRLIETPGCNKCTDPSIIEGDTGESSSGNEGTYGDHNSLSGLQGGVFEEYYHLTLAERNKLATMSQGSTTFIDRFKPTPKNIGDAWVNPETKVLTMYYNTLFNGVSVEHSTEADEVDGGYF